MPIKPPNQSSKVRIKGSAMRQGGGPAQDRRYLNESPQTTKTDRERIYDTKGFKDAVNKASESFSESAGRIKPGKATEDYLHYRMKHYGRGSPFKGKK